ncbi:MAG: hypothetical protein C0467_04025 [Planctomycetaceae bacterium]|nr:hypothetical protein [Planctomycetaceae bacterium]
MNDDLPTTPDEGDPASIDPFEAELVAYLDGELEPSAARKVEVRLAADPAARAKATALKKTFGLLDYLPKPEPSPTFASRTLERLPAMKSAQAQSPSNRAIPVPASQSSNSPTLASSSTIPASSPLGSGQFAPVAPPRSVFWAAGLMIAVGVCLAIGYLASGAVYPYLFASRANREASLDELSVTDHQIVERLPLYAAVDDLDFVNELAKPEFFGDDPEVLVDVATKPPTVEPENPTAAAFTKLATAFKAIPPARQQAIRDLDKELRSLDAPTRDQRLRVLETYTIWLTKLSEPDRKQVLTADTARRRLDEIRKIRNQQWIDSLPTAQRVKLNGLPAAGQVELIRQWRDEESARREEWAFHRTHADDIVSNKTPWPFDNASRQRDVIEFARVAFRLEDNKLCRLDETERARYAASLAQANEQGGWMAWYNYGRNVNLITKKYERFLLPEPATGEPVTKYEQLGTRAERWFEKGKGRVATLTLVGKWPDFALAVHNYAGTEKSDKIPLPPLGSARPSEFKEPLRSFVTRDLITVLALADRKALEALEGKWPDYPREVVRLAKQHDLVAPGLMVPCSPKRWDSMYGFGPRIKP